MTRLKLATSDTFRSMRSRNFRLFFTGQLISQVGNWLTLVAQTLLVFKLTHSGVALGFLAAAQFGPVLLIGAFAGLVADRSDKRKLLLIVQALRDAAVVRTRRDRLHGPSAGRGAFSPSRYSAASPPPSTTRPAARSSSRWCPTKTSTTPSASTARS